MYKFTIPTFILCWCVLGVVSNCGAIKVYRILPVPKYLLLPLISSLIVMLDVTMVPQCCNVYEKSSTIHGNIAQFTKTRYGRRIVNSLNIFGFETNVFMMRNSVKKRIIEHQLFYTANLLTTV